MAASIQLQKSKIRQPEQDRKERTATNRARTGQTERNSQNGTFRMEQPEWDSQNRTNRTGLPAKDCQDSTARHRWASTSSLMLAISDIDICYSDIRRKYVGLKTVILISEEF
jgi:hypothetical protein